ncbi:MAG: Eco29kI family restriction endonuclease [Xanthomonadaceae bacterium]|nr:Eco29kI family restriction endonuclease [Xanthomonadaceae bacterium]
MLIAASWSKPGRLTVGGEFETRCQAGIAATQRKAPRPPMWLLYADPEVDRLRRSGSGSFTPIIGWLHYGDPGMALLGRSMTGHLEASPGKVLYNRLKQHGKSIEEASNLDIDDFHCRYLIVDDIWIPLGESLLIAKFDPLWNKLIDGFGNHDPGSGRHAGLRPRWDVLHPGRPWAERCQPRDESADQIAREAKDYLRNNPPPDDASMITV